MRVSSKPKTRGRLAVVSRFFSPSRESRPSSATTRHGRLPPGRFIMSYYSTSGAQAGQAVGRFFGLTPADQDGPGRGRATRGRSGWSDFRFRGGRFFFGFFDFPAVSVATGEVPGGKLAGQQATVPE